MANLKITVSFYCEKWPLGDLAMAVGVNPVNVIARWKRLGRPKDITGHDEILREAGRANRPCRYVWVDSVRMRIHEAAALCGISKQTVIARANKYGSHLAKEQMCADERRVKGGEAPKTMPLRKGTSPALPTQDRSPGWWERENLPSAGTSKIKGTLKMGGERCTSI